MKTIKRLILTLAYLIMIFSSSWTIGQIKLPDSKAYDRIVAYEYEGGMSGHQYLIIENNKLAGNITKQVELDSNHIKSLSSTLGDPTTFDDDNVYFCFIPRLGIVFYKGKKVIDHYSICVECSKIINPNKDLPTSFSEEGTEQLRKFTSALGFKSKKILSHSNED